MLKLNPIIGVKDVKASANWYYEIFGLQNALENEFFAVLKSESSEIILNLHKWNEDKDGHPSLSNQKSEVGNGLLLYFRTDDLNAIWTKAQNLKAHILKEIHRNLNTQQDEFSMKDLDGYTITVTEYHEF